MNVVLWIVQLFLAVAFALAGAQKIVIPSNLPEQLQWIYDLPPALSYFIGAAELAAAVGLILPGLTKAQTRLTPLAALGLAIVMVGAVIFHLARGEFPNIGVNVLLLVLSVFVAYVRWRVRPLKARGAQA